MYGARDAGERRAPRPALVARVRTNTLAQLYWLDNAGKRLVAGALSDPPLTNPPTAPVVTSVTTLVDGIELPVGLAVEPTFVGIGAPPMPQRLLLPTRVLPPRPPRRLWRCQGGVAWVVGWWRGGVGKE